VTFLPLTWGAAWGAVSVTVAGPASSQTLPLSGSGVDFGLAVNAIQVVRGGSANTAYTVAALGGTYSNPVSLTCGNLPKGATCSFAQNPATPGANGLTSTLTITTVKGTQTGTYWIVIVGASSTGQHSVNSALTVTK
ncbi:MAG TPA: hypothetical protein VFI82_04160, partial [Terriglobales bacterium]|nr:hypothetical protein [Terriglobales bacterium]